MEISYGRMVAENLKQYLAQFTAHPHLLSFIKQTKGSVILDRAYPSEYVYSKIFDRETDFKAIRACDIACKQLKAEIFIFVRSDYSNVKDQFDFVDKDMLERIHTEYDNFAYVDLQPSAFY